MTRLYVYITVLVGFVAAFAMIVTSLWVPRWVSFSVTTTQGETIEKHIGLHRSCSSLNDPQCVEFPSDDLCQEGERYFCSMWRTIGFLASFTVVTSLATLSTFVIVISGGKYKRESNWSFVVGMLTVCSAIELALISMVAYLYDHDDQFRVPGWKLDVSWYISVVGGVLFLASAGGLTLTAYLLPPEDGYDFLEDPADA